MTIICSANLSASKIFYTTLFDPTVAFASDWFVHLRSQDGRLELGIIDRYHQVTPGEYRIFL